MRNSFYLSTLFFNFFYFFYFDNSQIYLFLHFAKSNLKSGEFGTLQRRNRVAINSAGGFLGKPLRRKVRDAKEIVQAPNHAAEI